MSLPHGFGIALVDFAFFVIFAIYSDNTFRPSTAYRWLFFTLCVIVALFFFFAWIVDLGARL
jgi:hypothetical protein